MGRDEARLELLARLKAEGYRFVTVTPATHARVVARPLEGAPGLRDVFGWNRAFSAADVDADIVALMERGELLERDAKGLHSRLRIASLGEDLFFHSAYPTEAEDAVFFGPDTYRFARFIAEWIAPSFAGRLADMGAGSGAGGIAAARLAPGARVSLIDTNPAALALARVNARAAGLAAECVRDDSLPDGMDMVVANPPYMMDDGGRAYRDGGDLLGGSVALAWVRDALAKLAPGGTMLLYTGAAYRDGASPLLAALQSACREAGASLNIEELDPDVFGEELERPRYAAVERIAAIGAVIRKSG